MAQMDKARRLARVLHEVDGLSDSKAKRYDELSDEEKKEVEAYAVELMRRGVRVEIGRG